MATITFRVNDSVNGTLVAVWVTVTEQADGTLLFSVTQDGPVVADLRGIFLDLNEALLGTVSVISAATNVQQGDDTVSNLGGGSNMQGVVTADGGGYDVGIEIGTAGIGKDDIRAFTFTLDSSLRDLTLQDIESLGARLTSVGIDGYRDGSAKLNEVVDAAIVAADDAAEVTEGGSASGSVLTNDNLTATVIAFSGGDIDTDIALSYEGAQVATLRVRADGTYTVTALDNDVLNEGDSVQFHFSYTAKHSDGANGFSTDTANFDLTVKGTGSACEIEIEPDSYPTTERALGNAILVFDTETGDARDTNNDGLLAIMVENIPAWQTVHDFDAIVNPIVDKLLITDVIDDCDVFLGAKLVSVTPSSAGIPYNDYWANDGSNTSIFASSLITGPVLVSPDSLPTSTISADLTIQASSFSTAPISVGPPILGPTSPTSPLDLTNQALNFG